MSVPTVTALRFEWTLGPSLKSYLETWKIAVESQTPLFAGVSEDGELLESPPDFVRVFERELAALLESFESATPDFEIPVSPKLLRPQFLDPIFEGVPRVELVILEGSNSLLDIFERSSAKGVEDGRLDLVTWFSKGKGLTLAGSPVALYVFSKSRRFKSFAEEWRGRSQSQSWRRIFFSCASALGPRKPIEVPSDACSQFLAEIDTILEQDPEVVRVVEDAGIRWEDWKRAGTSWRARWGLERVFF